MAIENVNGRFGVGTTDQEDLVLMRAMMRHTDQDWVMAAFRDFLAGKHITLRRYGALLVLTGDARLEFPDRKTYTAAEITRMGWWNTPRGKFRLKMLLRDLKDRGDQPAERLSRLLEVLQNQSAPASAKDQRIAELEARIAELEADKVDRDALLDEMAQANDKLYRRVKTLENKGDVNPEGLNYGDGAEVGDGREAQGQEGSADRQAVRGEPIAEADGQLSCGGARPARTRPPREDVCLGQFGAVRAHKEDDPSGAPSEDAAVRAPGSGIDMIKRMIERRRAA